MKKITTPFFAIFSALCLTMAPAAFSGDWSDGGDAVPPRETVAARPSAAPAAGDRGIFLPVMFAGALTAAGVAVFLKKDGDRIKKEKSARKRQKGEESNA